MSNTNNRPGTSGLGLQILYNTPHQRRLIEFGKLSNHQYEIEINLGTALNLMNSGSSGTKQYTIKTKEALNLESSFEPSSLPAHAIVLRYSQALFLILTAAARLQESWSSQFRELVLDRIEPARSVCPKYEDVLKSFITGIECSTSKTPGLYEAVYALTEIFTGFHLPEITNNGNISDKLKKLILEVEPLIEFIVRNGFVLPSDKIFRIITGCPKSVFLANFARQAEKPFKYFINKLKFRSEMIELIFTTKSIEEISLNHGYSEQSSFSRSVKNRTGMPPTLIRKIAREDVNNLLTKRKITRVPSILN